MEKTDKYQTDDLRIESIRAVTTPAVICEELPRVR